MCHIILSNTKNAKDVTMYFCTCANQANHVKKMKIIPKQGKLGKLMHESNQF